MIQPDARIAQLVEQATENRCVGGSNPPSGTTFFPVFERLRILQDILQLVPLFRNVSTDLMLAPLTRDHLSAAHWAQKGQ